MGYPVISTTALAIFFNCIVFMRFPRLILANSFKFFKRPFFVLADLRQQSKPLQTKYIYDKPEPYCPDKYEQ